MIHGHGSDLYNQTHPIIADFSSNVWYKGLSDGLLQHLNAKIKEVIHYPEPDAASVAKAIAEIHNVFPENVLVTNGATEAFYLLAQLFQVGDSTIVYPAFAEYEDACRVFNHTLHFVDNQHLTAQLPVENCQTLWLGNPNNPDGKVFAPDFVQRLCIENPFTHIIIDEAYAHLCSQFSSSLDLVATQRNLIVVHSLTKAFAIPGIRLGYIIADSEIIARLTSLKMPWSVNSFAIEASRYLLPRFKTLLPDLETLETESKEMQKRLSEVNGLEVTPSDCNYFLVRIKHHHASDLKQFLISKHGFLIRDASNFRGLDPHCFRIAIRDKETNILLVEAIREFIKTRKL